MNNYESHITPKPCSIDEQNQLLVDKIHSLKQQIARIKSKNLNKENATLPPSFMLPHNNAAHLKRFINSNILPVVRATINGECIEVNEAFAKLLGYTPGDFGKGKLSWKSITPAEWAFADDAAVASIMAGKKVIPFEKEYLRKDGTPVPVIVAITTPDSGMEECLVFIFDLTDLKKAESQLKSSESQFRLLAEVIPQIVWITDSHGRTRYCNQRFYETTGLSREKEDGFLWIKSLHEEDRQTFIDAAKISRKSESPFDLKVRYRLRNGDYHWYLFRAMPMSDLETKEPLWFGTCTDIDDQVKFEESLRQSELKFRTLADAIPQIVWSANNSGEIEFFNQRWFEYTGLTLEQSQDNGWQLLIHPDDLDEYLRKWRKCLLTGETYEMEFRLKPVIGFISEKENSGSNYRWHLARAVALRDPDGRISKWFATWTEIESQRKT